MESKAWPRVRAEQGLRPALGLGPGRGSTVESWDLARFDVPCIRWNTSESPQVQLGLGLGLGLEGGIPVRAHRCESWARVVPSGLRRSIVVYVVYEGRDYQQVGNKHELEPVGGGV